jgi:hypothetical protein
MAQTPEEKREYHRKWREANPEKFAANQRRYRQAHPEVGLESNRRWRAANPERARELSRESQRRRDEADPEGMREKRRQYYLANREELNEKARLRARKLREADPGRIREMKREWSRQRARERPAEERERFWGYKLARQHGMRPEDWAAMWEAQSGRCYLCGGEMTMERTHLDHDHRCCPRGKSCQYCRRGLACPECNQLIGLARDDPARLRQIAANLEVALAVVTLRLAGRDVQQALAFDQPAAAAAVDAIPAPARLRAVSGD